MFVGRVCWEKGANGMRRVQVSPELLDVCSAAEKWAEPFSAPLTDVIWVQADIADQVAQKLDGVEPTRKHLRVPVRQRGAGGGARRLRRQGDNERAVARAEFGGRTSRTKRLLLARQKRS
jgi:hypothetical protein